MGCCVQNNKNLKVTSNILNNNNDNNLNNRKSNYNYLDIQNTDIINNNNVIIYNTKIENNTYNSNKNHLNSISSLNKKQLSKLSTQNLENIDKQLTLNSNNNKIILNLNNTLVRRKSTVNLNKKKSNFFKNSKCTNSIVHDIYTDKKSNDLLNYINNKDWFNIIDLLDIKTVKEIGKLNSYFNNITKKPDLFFKFFNKNKFKKILYKNNKSINTINNIKKIEFIKDQSFCKENSNSNIQVSLDNTNLSINNSNINIVSIVDMGLYKNSIKENNIININNSSNKIESTGIKKIKLNKKVNSNTSISYCINTPEFEYSEASDINFSYISNINTSIILQNKDNIKDFNCNKENEKGDDLIDIKKYYNNKSSAFNSNNKSINKISSNIK